MARSSQNPCWLWVLDWMCRQQGSLYLQAHIIKICPQPVRGLTTWTLDNFLRWFRICNQLESEEMSLTTEKWDSGQPTESTLHSNLHHHKNLSTTRQRNDYMDSAQLLTLIPNLWIAQKWRNSLESMFYVGSPRRVEVFNPPSIPTKFDTILWNKLPQCSYITFNAHSKAVGLTKGEIWAGGYKLGQGARIPWWLQHDPNNPFCIHPD